jgi:hypothetical protein
MMRTIVQDVNPVASRPWCEHYADGPVEYAGLPRLLVAFCVLAEPDVLLALDVFAQPTRRPVQMCAACLIYLGRRYPLRTGWTQLTDMLVAPDLPVSPDVLVVVRLFSDTASTPVRIPQPLSWWANGSELAMFILRKWSDILR